MSSRPIVCTVLTSLLTSLGASTGVQGQEINSQSRRIDFARQAPAGAFPSNDESANQQNEVLAHDDWCMTRISREPDRHTIAAGPGCPTFGECDIPSVRNGWIPNAQTPIRQLRMHVLVFAESDGSNPAASEAEVDAQVARLNADLLPHRIQFCHTTSTINDSNYRIFSIPEETAMKQTYAVLPEITLNVFVTTVQGYLGQATFPFDPRALTDRGGIIIEASVFGAAFSVLTHEVGHCLGLFHTNAGVTDVSEPCSVCYERADGLNGDTTGDFASDTPPTPPNLTCNPPGGTDPCSGTPWGPTLVENFMGFAPSHCQSAFTVQQGARMQCWIDAVLTSWDCGNAGVTKFHQPPEPSGGAVAANHDFSDSTPNSVVADDFISDGRPTTALRWWGSHFSSGISNAQDRPDDQRGGFSVLSQTSICGDGIIGAGEQCDPPDGATCDEFCQSISASVIDGWLISFHEPVGLGGGMAEALGVYFCDSPSVGVTPMDEFNCDSLPIFEYQAVLAQCCLVVANPDSRTLGSPAQVDAFREEMCLSYDVGIQAVVGRRYTASGGVPGICDGFVSTGRSMNSDEWGLLTSNVGVGARAAQQGSSQLDQANPFFGEWLNIAPSCGSPNLAIELLTDVSGDFDCNDNGVADACELGEDCQSDGVLDECQIDGNDGNFNGIPDECDPTTPSFSASYGNNRTIEVMIPTALGDSFKVDDGIAEHSASWNSGFAGRSFGWANRYSNASSEPITVVAIEAAFGTSIGAPGVEIGNDVFGIIWIDTAATGNMVNAVKNVQWLLPGGVPETNGTFTTHFAPQAVVVPAGADFYVGLGDAQTLVDGERREPASIDETPPHAGRSWMFHHPSANVLDADDLAGQVIGTVESLSGGLRTGDWMIRARILPPPASTAIKVTLDELQAPNPPNPPCCPAPNFSVYESATCTAIGEENGCARWVGPPVTVLESQGNPLIGSYRAARLQCTPYYTDWTTLGSFSIVGAEIMPSSTYELVAYAGSCQGVESTCMNVSASVQTVTRRSGDVAASFNPPSTSIQPDAIDVVTMVNKFRNLPTAPSKRVAQIQPNVLELNTDMNALDIVGVVDAFRGLAYPFTGPCPCPSTVTCDATPCSSPTPCGGGLCVKTCNGGAHGGQPCLTDAHCPSSTCGAGFCRDRCARCRD